MILQRDPEAVAQLARLCQDENWRFRTFLKGVDLEFSIWCVTWK